MAYSLVGEAAHEWIGMAMLALFILIRLPGGKNTLQSKMIYKNGAAPNGSCTVFRLDQIRNTRSSRVGWAAGLSPQA